MALIVEDGTGKADAESYISVEDATAYHAARGNADWAALASNEVREQFLRKATAYMVQVYRDKWQGYRVFSSQALDWPRSCVVVDKVYTVDSDIVPNEVKNACAEFALRASVAELAPDVEQRVKREKVDVLEVEYSEFSPQYPTYRAIDNMLAPFFGAGSSGVFRKVERV